MCGCPLPSCPCPRPSDAMAPPSWVLPDDTCQNENSFKALAMYLHRLALIRQKDVCRECSCSLQVPRDLLQSSCPKLLCRFGQTACQQVRLLDNWLQKSCNVPEGFFASRNGHFANALRQLKSSLAIDGDKFVHAAQRRLCLTRDQVRADAKDVNFVLLLIE